MVHGFFSLLFLKLNHRFKCIFIRCFVFHLNYYFLNYAVTQSVTSVNKPATNQRGVDPFRSRVPNSSRAPSMHVDEFIALESKTENPAFALRRNPQVIDNCNLQHVFNAYF